MRPRSIVFDLFGDYLRYRGGEVRLRPLSALLSCFGVADSTTRVVMARLRREGWFDTRPVGRETVYRLTPRGWQLLDEGRSRIFDRVREPWDGQWQMVIYAVPESDRAVREELRKELAWLGFGPLASSTWISPHDRLAQVEQKFADHPTVRLDLLRCRSAGLLQDREMVGRCWDLDILNQDYQQLLRRYRPQLPHYRAGRIEPRQALVDRMQLIYDYRKFPFRDPDLPVELLPGGWRGREAHELFLAVHELLGEAAGRFVDQVLGEGCQPRLQVSLFR
ncbi:MAG: PaaX family transcriptional regulator [Actinobacteria bacterium]|jgi:phenylacetic acid degradation operon negative regulatory protein|nr:PaaX family transcriptional regulator [Actinomycetota bacterium]